MDCPICNHKDLSPFATRCPSCEADVVVFPLLEQLEEQAVELYKEGVAKDGKVAETEQGAKNKNVSLRKRLNRIYWFLLLLPILFFWCGKKNIPVRDAKMLATNQNLLDEKQRLESEKQALKEQLNSLKKQLILLQQPKKVTHIIKQGDNLSSLAKIYLGEARQWQEIARLNPFIKNSNLLHIGDTIEIKLREH